MLLLSTLLLTADPNVLEVLALAVAKVISNVIIPVAGALVSLYLYRKNNNKEDKKIFDEKLKKMQNQIDDQAMLIQGHQAERERLVDINNLRLKTIEQRISVVDIVVTDVQLIKARLDSYGQQIIEVKDSQKEMRVEMRQQNRDLVDLIKSMK